MSENLSDHRRVFDTGESLPRERSECFGYYLDETGIFATFIGLLEGLLVAYSVEKLDSVGILINSNQQTLYNLLFLLNVDSGEMPKFSRKGVFQQNRPKAVIRDAQI